MDPFTILCIAGAALAAVWLAKITWKAICNWITRTFNKTSWLFWKKNAQVHLLRERLANGNFAVVGGVFNKKLELTSQERWEGKQLDAELEKFFDGREYVVLDNC